LVHHNFFAFCCPPAGNKTQRNIFGGFMRRIFALVLLAGLLAGLLAACGGAGATSGPTQPPAAPGSVKAVQDYLQAVVSKDVDKVSTLSCKDWEQSAVQEVDSLQAVKAELSGLVCTQSGSDAAGALVKCQGKIVITYNTEQQDLDLSLRTYKVSQVGGDWLVCGYQQ
jgi:hypothetical protein